MKGYTQKDRKRARELFPSGYLTRDRLAIAKFSRKYEKAAPNTKISFREGATACYPGYSSIPSAKAKKIVAEKFGKLVIKLATALGSQDANGYGECIAPQSERGMQNDRQPQSIEEALFDIKGEHEFLPYTGVVVNSPMHYAAWTKWNRKVAEGLDDVNKKRQREAKRLMPASVQQQLLLTS
jgi:hypothetical protein